MELTIPAVIEDYAQILETHYLNYKPTGYHLQVGEILVAQGWILHISAVRGHIPNLLEHLLPILSSAHVPFKVVKDKETARNVLDGNLGHYQVGKVLKIYPDTENLALLLAKELVGLTKSFRGPKILTDAYLGGSVYTRYGSFNQTHLKDSPDKENVYIYDPIGKLVIDSYSIPFTVPEGRTWPFSSLAVPKNPPPNKILNNKYRLFSPLKIDSKGNVYKTLYLRRKLLLGWCIIKEGKKNMWCDDLGRDMCDRIQWQLRLHKALESEVALPKIIDHFENDGDSYIAMEYIQGRSLFQISSSLNRQSLAWRFIDQESKLLILDYIDQIIDILGKMHAQGYIHRDVTPVNFLVNSKHKVYIIDNELSYSAIEKYPAPPFEAGTYGFMSPEQENQETPTVKEDIYGLGATMLFLLTGMSPLTFQTSKIDSSTESLTFFIGNSRLSKMVALCLSPHIDRRPALPVIKQCISQMLKELQSNGQSNTNENNTRLDKNMLVEIINSSIRGLVDTPTMISNNMWLSKSEILEDIPENQKIEFSPSIGLYEGVSGVLYVLARAKELGFSIDPCYPTLENGWNYINCNFLASLPDVPAGLYKGSAGVAVAVASCIHAGILKANKDNKSKITSCLEVSANQLNLSNGLAGIGLAMLQCKAFLQLDKLKSNLDTIWTSLTDKANYDWIGVSDLPALDKQNDIRFANGHLGIIWFLLEYHINYPSRNTENQVIKDLKILDRKRKQLEKTVSKKGIREIIVTDPRTTKIIYGVALVYIKAYQALKEPKFKRYAESVLSIFQPNFVHDNFTQDMGLAGLGELYLEAYLTFGNRKWLERAEFIANVFYNTRQYSPSGSCYWRGGNSKVPTADLMVGNSGIIHFLIRYLYPQRVGLRLLS